MVPFEWGVIKAVIPALTEPKPVQTAYKQIVEPWWKELEQ